MSLFKFFYSKVKKKKKSLCFSQNSKHFCSTIRANPFHCFHFVFHYDFLWIFDFDLFSTFHTSCCWHFYPLFLAVALKISIYYIIFSVYFYIFWLFSLNQQPRLKARYVGTKKAIKDASEVVGSKKAYQQPQLK